MSTFLLVNDKVTGAGCVYLLASAGVPAMKVHKGDKSRVNLPGIEVKYWAAVKEGSGPEETDQTRKGVDQRGG